MSIQRVMKELGRLSRPVMVKKLTVLPLSMVLILGSIPTGWSTTRAQASPAFFFVDLATNTVSNQSGGAVTVISGPTGGQAVVRITLNPDVNGYSRAIFTIRYSSTPTNWTMNIGDSATNNGGGGDGGTQSNDAEMQILGSTLTAFANDGSPGILLSRASVVAAGETISFEVKDNFLGWGSGNRPQAHVRSPFLYALDGQADSEGPVNFDVYAGFNRTVGDSSRFGTGVSWVMIQLLP